MGKLEPESSRRLRKGELRKATLSIVGVAGLLLVASAAPNCIQLLKYIPRNKHRFAFQTRNTLTRLSQQGLVRFVHKDGDRYVELTNRGREHIIRMQKLPTRGRWDGRWRVVMFDVPERRKRTRDTLRYRMRELGFVRFQDSAWIFPFDCEDIVELVKTELRLGSNVQYMIADIANDLRWRKEFSLPQHS